MGSTAGRAPHAALKAVQPGLPRLSCTLGVGAVIMAEEAIFVAEERVSNVEATA